MKPMEFVEYGEIRWNGDVGDDEEVWNPALCG